MQAQTIHLLLLLACASLWRCPVSKQVEKQRTMELRTVKILEGAKGREMAFSLPSSRWASSDGYGAITIWNGWQREKQFMQNPAERGRLSWDKGGQLLYAGLNTYSAIDQATWKVKTLRPALTDGIPGSFSPMEEYFTIRNCATGPDGGDLIVLVEYSPPRISGSGYHYSGPQAQLLAFGREDGKLKQVLVPDLKRPALWGVEPVREGLLAWADDSIFLWRKRDDEYELEEQWKAPVGTLKQVTCSADGKSWLGIALDGRAFFLKIPNNKAATTWQAHNKEGLKALFHPLDGQRFVTCSSYELKTWSIEETVSQDGQIVSSSIINMEFGHQGYLYLAIEGGQPHIQVLECPDKQ